MKKITYLLLALVLAIGTLTACGSSDKESGTKEAAGKTIKVAASATPHAIILEEAKTLLKKQGWDLEINVFDDYVHPNNVVESG